MATTLTHTTTLVTVTCWCGIAHAIPSSLNKASDNDPKQVVYCPLGHQWVRSGPSKAEKEAQRLREEKERLERRLAGKDDTIRRQGENLAAERRSKAAIQGHLTRAKNRIANGVCPVPGCKRSGFDQVLRHISTEHPDWLHQHPEIGEGA